MQSKFSKEVREKAELKDILLIASVPIALILVFLLPESVQESLALNFTSPSPVNFFTSAFVHSGLNHLAGNLASYIILIVPLYLMCVLSGLRRRFCQVFLVFVFIFPFLISAINLHFLPVETSGGFSGIDSAFLGFLPVVVFHYLERRLDLDLGTSNSVGLFLLGTETLVLIYSGLSIAFLAVLGLIAFYLWRIQRRTDLSSLKEAFRKKGYFEISTMSILLFLAMPFLLFPKDIVVGGKAINILSHYSGFFLGFFVPYFWFQMEKRTLGIIKVKIPEYYLGERLKERSKGLLFSVLPVVAVIIALAVLDFTNLISLSLRTWLVSVLTLIIAGIALWEVFTLAIMWPVEVRVVSAEDRDEGEDFAIVVENITARSISGGSKFCVLPRDLKLDGKENVVKRISNLQPYLLGKDDSLKIVEEPLDGGALYCTLPAGALERTTGRGIWATYLDPQGGDKAKKITSYPPPVYRNTVRNMINECAKRLADREDIDNARQEIQDRIEDIEEGYEKKTGASPQEFYHCVFPPIKLDCEQKIELTLRNIGKYKFVKEEGNWKLEKREKHRL